MENKARVFCNQVRELAKTHNLPFFVVTEGASATSNNGCSAVRNARERHVEWEIENGHNPREDWSKTFESEETYNKINK